MFIIFPNFVDHKSILSLMKMTVFLIACLLITSSAVFAQEDIVINADLKLTRISPNVFIHVSQLNTAQFGKVGCNGLLYLGKDEALLMDTPPTEELSRDLLSWFKQNYPGHRLKGVIVNHFHADCLGGLRVFHAERIESYSHVLTPTLLMQNRDTFDIPQNVFSKSLTLRISGKKVQCYYPGEAHTRDNIVTWIEDEKILFGGCPVKTLNAGKGNIADANIQTWSESIRNVKRKFSAAKIVVPGHGAHGGIELLDFTIRLFENDEKKD